MTTGAPNLGGGPSFDNIAYVAGIVSTFAKNASNSQKTGNANCQERRGGLLYMRESHGDRVNARNTLGSAADASLQESVDEAIVTPIAAREKAARSLLEDLRNGGATLGEAVNASFPGGRLCKQLWHPLSPVEAAQKASRKSPKRTENCSRRELTRKTSMWPM